MARVRDFLAEASEAGEAGLGGFGPDERFQVDVSVVDIAVERGFEIVSPFNDAALQAFADKKRDLAFDEVAH